jgi:hypothetical protein
MWGRVTFVAVTSIVTACLIKPDPPSQRNGDAGGDDAGNDAPSSTQNYMFVTSQTFLTDSITSAQKADQLCMQAAAGHFPGTFVAWFSDVQSKATDRLATTRGWLRPDGKPFANDARGPVFYPPRLDESGTDVAATGGSLLVGTNTNTDGSPNTACGSGVLTGFLDGGAAAWTAGGGCMASAFRLYCFGTGHSNDVAPAPVTNPTAFRSSTSVVGASFLSLEQVCINEAAQAGIPGTFRALVEQTGMPAAMHVRGTHTGAASWVRKDGVVVSHDAANFDAPIELDVHGNRVSAGGSTWGGAANPNATGVNSDCNDWTLSTGSGSATGSGAVGSSDRSHMPEAFGSAISVCGSANFVYCLAAQ